MPPIKAPRRFAITLTGETAPFANARPEQWNQINYLLQRLLSGEPIAPTELGYFGLSIDIAVGADGQALAGQQ